MLRHLRSLLTTRFSAEPDGPRVPAGERIYAVGDIHGRLDLFDALAEAIEADDAARGSARTTVILLGDLVDRGPESAGVVDAARWWQRQRYVRVLMGNHEEMMLRSMESLDTLRHFLRHGGKQTLLSYGVDARVLASADVDELQALMRRCVPAYTIAWLEGLEDQIAVGDYLFVHAGIDPVTPIDQQKASDLRWIREPFLSHDEPFGPVVVHGHTITSMPEARTNRIGIDTGAYASGRLTALALEGASRRYIEAIDEGGTIRVSSRVVA